MLNQVSYWDTYLVEYTLILAVVTISSSDSSAVDNREINTGADKAKSQSEEKNSKIGEHKNEGQGGTTTGYEVKEVESTKGQELVEGTNNEEKKGPFEGTGWVLSNTRIHTLQFDKA